MNSRKNAPSPARAAKRAPAQQSRALQQARAVQPKMSSATQSKRRPAAPPVYRPQPAPQAAQPKTADAAQGRTPPAAPPVYRPEPKKFIQPKMAAQQPKSPTAPPVYRPQPLPKVLQRKVIASQQPPQGQSTNGAAAPNACRLPHSHGAARACDTRHESKQAGRGPLAPPERPSPRALGPLRPGSVQARMAVPQTLTAPDTRPHGLTRAGAGVVQRFTSNVIQRRVNLPNAAETLLIAHVLTFLNQVETGVQAAGDVNVFVDNFDVIYTGALNPLNAAANIGTHLTNNTAHAGHAVTLLMAGWFAGVAFNQVPHMTDHLAPLTKKVDEVLQMQGMNFGIGHTYVAGGGADCMQAGNIQGLTFAQINAAATQNGGVLHNDEIGANGARSRITWRWADGSEINMDVPGNQAKETYEVSYQPHCHKVANDATHLSDGGVGVPAFSHPAHITFNYDHNSLKDHIRQNGGTWPY